MLNKQRRPVCGVHERKIKRARRDRHLKLHTAAVYNTFICYLTAEAVGRENSKE